jgi:hypothetical protein
MSIEETARNLSIETGAGDMKRPEKLRLGAERGRR